ncbi:hypothetical protein BRPE64_ACDS04850 [Caballeronia insecticola]|uniref:Uncharacterized protein n=1 Tax=Caballeronia insecticola TaxID=758793 RepID=R4WFI7_9BURK|nr:hypothetical protein BRPE64_ACDS04850 [Caballeronia insecticola]
MSDLKNNAAHRLGASRRLWWVSMAPAVQQRPERGRTRRTSRRAAS